MRKNYTQAGQRDRNGRTYIDGDWFAHGIASNVSISPTAYIDTSYGFAGFHSEQALGLEIGEGSGCYDRSSFTVSPTGKITIGNYSILNGTNIICSHNIRIGNHCMISWSSFITDNWLHAGVYDASVRKKLLEATAHDSRRFFPFGGYTAPVVIEDNCWIGFGSVILPGVTIGEGSVIGCKSIIRNDVPKYAVVAGDPQHLIRFLKPGERLATSDPINKIS